MSNSLTTERALANSLKDLMVTRSINKITVKEVTDKCGITRRTFYNHFNDIYELLGWLYEHEIIEDIEQHCNLKEWKIATSMILNYTIENKEICLNTFNSLGRDFLEKFIYNTFFYALKLVIEDITSDICIDENVKYENTRFYTLAIVGEFVLWLRNGLKEEVESILSRIERMMNNTLYYNLIMGNRKA